MKLRPSTLLLASLALACVGPRATSTSATVGSAPASASVAPAPAPADTGSVAWLIREGMRSDRVSEDLRHLISVIGPRLTGSPAMRRANDWVAQKLTDYGATSVSLEPYPFGQTWQRGPFSMRMLAPHERWIHAASWAWAPGTGGARVGDVVMMTATTTADFEARFAGRIRGSWVMLEQPYPRVNPFFPDPADSARVDSLRRARQREFSTDERAFLAGLQRRLSEEGIAGELIDGGKDYGLLTMSGSPDDIALFPRAVVPNHAYAEFAHLLARGDRVRVELNISNTIGRDTVVQWNTVGELRGSDLSNEVVLLGAHLDSWDLGTGATDNATSSIAVLEAARLLGALARSGARPRRTIRFAFFSGEEQGLLGSQYYILRHREEMPRMQAVLILDNGTGRITGFPLQGRDDLRAFFTGLMRPLERVGPVTVRSGRKGGTDHLPFLAVGVPAFNYDQLSRGYDYTHHSQADVWAHVVVPDVRQAAMVMAVNAWQLANSELRLSPAGR